ncbi:MAG: type II secretion system protein N [Alcanivoracaceae bacterium]
MNQAQLQKQLSRADRPARVLFGVVLLVWLGWWCADTFWLLQSGPRQVTTDERLPVIAASGSTTRESVSVERIRSWEVFGNAERVEQVAVTTEAPDTRLRLELLGLFQHPDSVFASAIIAEQGREGELFRVGDRVPGNATLEEILPDRVILLRAGQREALRLKEPDASSLAAPATAAAPAAVARPNRLDRRAGVQAPRVETMQTDPVIGDDGGDLGAQRSMIIQQLGLAPSGSEGYLIGATAPREMLQQVGLRPGDVIVSVNGFTLGDEGNDVAALQEFRNSGAASIVVQRGAQRFTVNYPP